MSSCDGVSPIVFRAGSVHPEGVTYTQRGAPVKTHVNATDPRTELLGKFG